MGYQGFDWRESEVRENLCQNLNGCVNSLDEYEKTHAPRVLDNWNSDTVVVHHPQVKSYTSESIGLHRFEPGYEAIEKAEVTPFFNLASKKLTEVVDDSEFELV
ncbi:hypothetical protein BGC07_02070 [Piscirickettsia litoralis]|uniref:Uncharacterized protein n=2 Tax=Piscirickettsia litoralis TaxID=1891921 RepID=A0ABX2ZZC8_9GAMM|nr:hypothetical protein BGC07_02070 [Piscirickettsia litoralis]